MAGALALASLSALPAQMAHAAGIIVNGNGDLVSADGFCTLREAMLNANANDQSGSADCAAGAGADTITFVLGISPTITLNGTPLPAITGPLAIDGSSQLSLTVSGNNASGVFQISANAQVTMTALTVENANATNGAIQNGGTLRLNNLTVRNSTAQSGGGIYNNGTLMLMNSRVVSNTADAGGGIYNFSGTLSIQNSNVLSNRAISATLGGGGIYSVGSSVSPASVTLDGSTVASNTSASRGGGIFNDAASAMTLRNSTISGNTATDGGGVFNSGVVGGFSLGYVTLANNTASAGAGGLQAQSGSAASAIGTIIAGNAGTTANDCAGEALNSLGYNLIGSTAGCAITGTTGTNVTNVAALLGSLADNGGPTLTHLPQAGSPALDVIPFGLAVCNLTSVDQRGTLRPRGLQCDIGAVEAQSSGAALIVTKTASASIVVPAMTFSYTILVRNTGSATAAGTLISDTLPLSVTLGGPISFQPMRTDATDALLFGADIAAGDTATLTIPVRLVNGVPAGTVLTNTVLVSSAAISTPVTASVTVTVGYAQYLPLVARDTPTSTITTTVQ
jgi:uncharacterized repeat protein (TIGR01451 family)